MTLDTTNTPEPTDATAKKPARRRVTRAAAAPSAETAEKTPAGQAEQAGSAPQEGTPTKDAPTKDAPTKDAPTKSTAANGSAATSSPDGGDAPVAKTRSRRATAPKAAPKSTAQKASDAPAADDASSARPVVEPAAPEAPAATAPAATAPAAKAPRRSRRVTKTTEQLDVFAELSGSSSDSTAAEPTAEPTAARTASTEPAPTATEPAEDAAPKRRTRSATRKASAPATSAPTSTPSTAPASSAAESSAQQASESVDATDSGASSPASQGVAEAPPRAPRRSRSRAAAPASTPSREDEVASLDVVASIEALGTAPATKPARRSRKATSAPATSAPETALFDDTEVSRPRRSATRAAAAPVEPAATEVEPDAPVDSATAQPSTSSASDVEPAGDAPRKTRSRRSRSTAAESATTQSAGAERTTSEAREPAAPESRTPATGAAPQARTAPHEGSEDTEPAEEAPVRRTTALLFQAPDPEASRPRRRRAQTPAGPPKAVSEAAAAVADELTEDDELEVSDEALDTTAAQGGTQDGADAADEAGAADEAEASDDEDTSGAPRRRRRRGGRGRRNRGASDQRDDEPQGDEDEAEAETEDSTDSGSDEGSRTDGGRSRSRRRGRGTGQAQGSDVQDDEPEGSDDAADENDSDDSEDSASSRRRRRRRRGSRGSDSDAAPSTQGSGRSSGGSSRSGRTGSDEVTALKGSTRLEAKRQRRREGRDAGRRRSVITEAEFLARREAVERSMIVRERNGRTQIAVLEDGVLVEHYVSQQSQASMAGNVYLGRVQNVLPSMEAAFIDVGKGRNAVLYAGEVNWDAAGMEGQPRRIEQALKSGDSVLVQVTKDPIGQKGARLTSQVTLAGRYLVYVPGGGMTGISRKLPDTERARLKKILREVVPETAGVIVRTAAEGASEDELRADIARLQGQWEAIEKKAKTASAPALLQGEPDLAIRVVRDIFNDDFTSLTVSGDGAWSEISEYVNALAPDLVERVKRWTSEKDVFAEARIDEQLAKGMDRKVWLPSGGSLVIDRTEAMTVVDVNTGKFTGSGGTLEETVTRNNLEAAEEIVRQLRLRDIGGIIVIDFIDMVLESNRDLVLRRLVECLGRDRTKHQVAEVTSLGLVQMTRKRVGQGLVEAFSETCDHCNGRGFIVHDEPNEKHFQGGSQPSGAQAAAQSSSASADGADSKRSRRKRNGSKESESAAVPVLPEARESVKATLATIAAAAAHAHEHDDEHATPAEGVVPVEHDAGESAAVEPTSSVDPTSSVEPTDGVEQTASASLPDGGEQKADQQKARAVKGGTAKASTKKASTRRATTEKAGAKKAVGQRADEPSAGEQVGGVAETSQVAEESPAAPVVPDRPVLDVVAELRSVRRSGAGRGQVEAQQEQ